jgi:integrase/recombinase XerD
MEKIKAKLITCTPVLWTHTTTKEGKHPVKIRATFNRESKYYNVQINTDGKREKLYLTVSEWEKVNQEKPRGENRERKLWIQKAVNGAYNAYEIAIKNNRPFSFDRFEAEFLAQDAGSGILKIFENNLQALLNDNQIGTYRTYLCAYNAFKRFRKDKDMNPADLTPGVLKAFEKYLLTPKLHKHRKNLKAANKTYPSDNPHILRAINCQ